MEDVTEEDIALVGFKIYVTGTNVIPQDEGCPADSEHPIGDEENDRIPVILAGIYKTMVRRCTLMFLTSRRHVAQNGGMFLVDWSSPVSIHREVRQIPDSGQR